MSTSPADRIHASKTIVIRKWHVAALLIGAVLLGAFFYSRHREAVEIRVVSPCYQDIQSTMATSGTVSPVNDFPARANFSGMVEKIFVRLGQNVRPGQLLLRMKDQYAESRLSAARATLDAAQVNEENVLNNGSQEDRIGFASDLVRTKSEQQSASSAYADLLYLRKKGSVSDAEVTAGKQRLDAANAALQALQQRTTHRYSPTDLKTWRDRLLADKQAVQAEQVSYANANISSPIAGVVYAIPVQPYDFVSAGADLLHVGDLSKMKIRAEFDQPEISKLHNGEQVAVTWDGMPGKSWKGQIVSTPLSVTRIGPRSVGICTIELDNAHHDLPAETNVSVTVTVATHRHVLTIPHEALHTEDASRFVFRVVDGQLKKTPVETGLVNVQRVEITKGLKDSDVLALHATDGDRLKDGMSVKTGK